MGDCWILYDLITWQRLPFPKCNSLTSVWGLLGWLYQVRTLTITNGWKSGIPFAAPKVALKYWSPSIASITENNKIKGLRGRFHSSGIHFYLQNAVLLAIPPIIYYWGYCQATFPHSQFRRTCITHRSLCVA